MKFHIACLWCEFASLLLLPLWTHWTPSWQEIYCHWETIMSVIMSLCKELCEALYIISYCLCLRHNFMHWQERLIFTRALRSKTFWGYVKYIFSVTSYVVVEVPRVYQKFTILRWLNCNLLALLYITTEKGHVTTKNSQTMKLLVWEENTLIP